MSSKNKQKETAATRGSASVDEDGHGGGGNGGGGGAGHKSPRDFATDGKGGSGINRVNRRFLYNDSLVVLRSSPILNPGR